jgi:hypothetical protein
VRQSRQEQQHGRRRVARRLGVVLAVAVALLGSAGLASATPPAGEWRTSPSPSPVNAVHVAVMRNGKVLLAAGSGNDRGWFDAGVFGTSVWDPVTETTTAIDTPWDLFCAGHAFLPDGRLLVTGGTSAYPGPATNNANAGLKDAYTFDPVTRRYERVPDMGLARWYPTVTELGDGRLFVWGGLDERGLRTNEHQTFDGSTWSPLAPAPAPLAGGPMYASLHLLRDGRLFYSGANVFGAAGATPGIWDLTTNGFQPVGGLTDPGRRDQAASILLPPAQDQKVMVIGGGHQDLPVPAVSSTAIVDLAAPQPQYVPGPPIDTEKMYVSAVILPDSTVFETGGASTTIHNGDRPVQSAQIYDPKSSTWTKVATPSVGRTYHSSAVLLPDGRVATFGGNPVGRFEMRIEVFTPPYLQKGTPRPRIVDAPTEIRYGSTFGFRTTQAAPITSAALVAPMAVTHSTDNNQRLVSLGVVTTANGVSVTVPDEPNLAPPGWYMLFLVDANGVPSTASWVHLTGNVTSSGGYTLDGFGGLHPFATGGGAKPPLITNGPYWPGWDIARGTVPTADRRAGYVVDGYGGLHPYAAPGTTRPARTSGGPYWRGWDIVRGAATLPNGSGGYVLDGYGGLHPFRIGAGAMPPPVSGAPYWKGKDRARGVTILPDGTGGYVLDDTGRLHPFRIGNGVMPPAIATPYTPGAVPVRGVTVAASGGGGYVLDGYGRLHRFAIGTGTAPTVSGAPRWQGWAIARGVSI